jgi:hypothetical protein
MPRHIESSPLGRMLERVRDSSADASIVRTRCARSTDEQIRNLAAVVRDVAGLSPVRREKQRASKYDRHDFEPGGPVQIMDHLAISLPEMHEYA